MNNNQSSGLFCFSNHGCEWSTKDLIEESLSETIRVNSLLSIILKNLSSADENIDVANSLLVATERLDWIIAKSGKAISAIFETPLSGSLNGNNATTASPHASTIKPKAKHQSTPILHPAPDADLSNTNAYTQFSPDNSDAFDITDRICQRRLELGLSHKGLGDLLGLSPECILDWEDGSQIEHSYLIALTRALQCDLIWLLSGEHTEPKIIQPTPADLYSHMETIIRSMDDFRASIAAPKAQIFDSVAQPVDLGSRIWMCRENQELSRGWIAGQLGVKPKAISMWECGTAQPDIKQVTSLASIFGVEPAWLAFDVIPDTGSTQLVAEPVPVEVMKGVDPAGIGKRIQLRRVELRMSHHKLAAKLNTPERNVFLWETGKQIPPSSCIDKIAAVLNCSVIWLLTGKPGKAQKKEPETTSDDEPGYTITNRINQRRLELGMSVETLAWAVNLDSDIIQQWIEGRGEPVGSVLLPLAIALQCNLTWLLADHSTAITQES